MRLGMRTKLKIKEQKEVYKIKTRELLFLVGA